MKLKLVSVCLLLGAIVLGATAVLGGAPAAAQAPGPSAGEVLVEGLLQPKGITLGPDGMLYVAESGTGGDTAFTLEGTDFKNGYTGRISKVDPDTGARTTIVDGLPSNGSVEFGEAVGPADVAFTGSDLYYLQTHAGEVWGFPDFETGVYRVSDEGNLTLIADIGEFNADNPVEAITTGAQVDIEPGGNPYSMIARGGAFYVSDGNHNRLLKVTTGGDISEITEFPNHPVSTGIASTGSGVFYVALLGQGPFFPKDGKVVSVGPLTGNITELASGASMLTDVQLGPGGQLYALQFNDTTQAGEELIAPFTGSVLKVNSDGTMTPVVTGLSFATFMQFDGDTLYVVNWGVTDAGAILKIEDFSALKPPAPQPPAAPPATPTRTTGVTAPDTGSGGYGDDGTPYSVLAALLAVIAAGTFGAAYALRRARR